MSASSRPSILAITSQAPWPLDRGGHLRSFHLLRGLAKRFRVSLIAGVDAARYDDSAFKNAQIAFHPVLLPPRTSVTEARRVVSAAVHREPYVCFRRHNRPEMRAAVRKQLAAETPDLLYLDHLDSLLFAKQGQRIPTVIDLHNVYSTLISRTADESSPIRRLYLHAESRRLRRMDARAALACDALFVVSDGDCSSYRQLGASNIRVILNGVDCASYAELPTGRPGVSPVILFVGTLSWGPNASAARYLIEDVLPAVQAVIPAARVKIVGREPSPELMALGKRPGVEIAASVPDVRPHLAEAALLAVPLEAGGGSRLKILEAFAAGLPVVSTVIGAEGLEVAPDVHLSTAARSEFAQAIVRVLQDDTLSTRLATNARELVKRRYDWEPIGQLACDAVSDVLLR
jgi:glycosyltransferase involved in cell wall biosynthesis